MVMETDILLAVALSIYLAIAGIIDLKTHKVPNWLTLPALAGLALWRIARREPIFLVYWAVIYLLWEARIWGAGDAKLLMVLFGLWPETGFLFIEALTVLVLGIPLLIAKYWGRSPMELAQAVHVRLLTGQILPTEEELAKAPPASCLLAAGGVVYAWLACFGLKVAG